VKDAAAFLDALAGPEPGGRYHVGRSVSSYLMALDRPLPMLEIAYAARRPDGSAIDPEIAAAVEWAVSLLERTGHKTVEIKLPDEPDLGSASELIGFVESSLLVRMRAREIGREPRNDEIEALTEHAIERVRALDAVTYQEARQGLHEATFRICAAFAPYDLVVTPTTGLPPPPLGWFDSRSRPLDIDIWNRRSAAFAPFTAMFSATGSPAISIPAGLTKTGLPIGIQLAAAQGRDHLVLQAGHRLLEAMGGPPARPEARPA
jgi:amidase